MFACNGILFNHESPIRGETFVTRKITRGACRILFGLQKKIFLGNLNAKRDWGHAKDYVEGMYLILQQSAPDDYILATGKTTEIRTFVELTFKNLGINIVFTGEGINEVGVVDSYDEGILSRKLQLLQCSNETIEQIMHNIKHLQGKAVVAVDSRYFRPSEVDILLGDPTKAKTVLGWEPKHTVDDLVADMISGDLVQSYREYVLHTCGFGVNKNCEM
jgi:GDPmannose 4,6-dehydratase